jgi:hypothetical protein
VTEQAELAAEEAQEAREDRAPARRRVHPTVPGALLLVVAAGLGAAFLTAPPASPEEGTGLVAPAPTTPAPTAPAPVERPTPALHSAGTPLGNPPPAPPGGGSHEFVHLQTDGISPVAYDPCRAVHYVVRDSLAPDGGDEVLAMAVQRVSELTGLQFVADGGTDEPGTWAERAPFQPERYGDRWVPVLVSWETDEENPRLADGIVGEAGSSWRALGDGPRVYVTGTVSLDAPQLADVLDRSEGRELAVAIVAHELAHLVGLSHVDDPTQLMYPEAQQDVTDFGAGDRTGLTRLGSGLCAPEL